MHNRASGKPEMQGIEEKETAVYKELQRSSGSSTKVGEQLQQRTDSASLQVPVLPPTLVACRGIVEG
jgi:hypothetical protein